MGDAGLSGSSHTSAQPACPRLSPRSAGRPVGWGAGESGRWTVEAGRGWTGLLPSRSEGVCGGEACLASPPSLASWVLPLTARWWPVPHPLPARVVVGSRSSGPETVPHMDLSGAVRERSWCLGSSRGAARPGRAWSVLSVPLPAARGSACCVDPASPGQQAVREVEVQAQLWALGPLPYCCVWGSHGAGAARGTAFPSMLLGLPEAVIPPFPALSPPGSWGTWAGGFMGPFSALPGPALPSGLRGPPRGGGLVLSAL